MKTLTGSCLCRKIKFRIPDKFHYMGNCHCSECRKFTGAAFSAAAGIDCNELEITEGKEFISFYHKTEDTDLAFCNNCGSSLFSKKLNTNICNIRLGVLDDNPSQKPSFHIFVASKAPWFEITDDLKQFDEMPESK